MISNCGHDEKGKYNGGRAGDQGGEWEIIGWYSRPWNVVLRHPKRGVGQLIADLAYKAALNDNIGYDQDQRYTYWSALQKAGYDPARIDTLCEADCSSGVAANVRAAGCILGMPELQKVSIYAYTGNLRNALVNAGFTALTENKYLNSDAYLLPGDILLYEGHHTATNLSTGAMAEAEPPESFPKWVQSGKDWYYRLAPGQNAHGWKDINHHRYYFDGNGKMLTDWQMIDGEWYYFQPSGGLEGAMYISDANGRQMIKFIN